MTTFATKKTPNIKREASGLNSQRTKRRWSRTPVPSVRRGDGECIEVRTAAKSFDDYVDTENEDCRSLAPIKHERDSIKRPVFIISHCPSMSGGYRSNTYVQNLPSLLLDCVTEVNLTWSLKSRYCTQNSADIPYKYRRPIAHIIYLATKKTIFGFVIPRCVLEFRNIPLQINLTSSENVSVAS